jgi:hypothetical protein
MGETLQTVLPQNPLADDFGLCSIFILSLTVNKKTAGDQTHPMSWPLTQAMHDSPTAVIPFHALLKKKRKLRRDAMQSHI